MADADTAPTHQDLQADLLAAQARYDAALSALPEPQVLAIVANALLQPAFAGQLATLERAMDHITDPLIANTLGNLIQSARLVPRLVAQKAVTTTQTAPAS